MGGLAIFADVNIQIHIFGDVKIGFVDTKIAIDTVEIVVVAWARGTGLILDTTVPPERLEDPLRVGTDDAHLGITTLE